LPDTGTGYPNPYWLWDGPSLGWWYGTTTWDPQTPVRFVVTAAGAT
jgi:hypothetical protein